MAERCASGHCQFRLAGITVHRRPRPTALRPNLRDPCRRNLKPPCDIHGAITRSKLLRNPPVPAVEPLEPCTLGIRQLRPTRSPSLRLYSDRARHDAGDLLPGTGQPQDRAGQDALAVGTLRERPRRLVGLRVVEHHERGPYRARDGHRFCSQLVANTGVVSRPLPKARNCAHSKAQGPAEFRWAL